MQDTETGDKTINCTCDAVLYPEFPNLKFGKLIENTIVFDATQYLKSAKLPYTYTIPDFLQKYRYIITSIKNYCNLTEICWVVENGHYLIDNSLTFFFISYTDTNFMLYMNERISELFTDGYVISDSRIAELAKARLPKEVILKITDEQQSI